MTAFPDRIGRSLPAAVGTARSSGTASRERLPWPIAIFLILVIIPASFNLGPFLLTPLRLYLIVMILPLMFGWIRGRFGRIIATDILFILHLVWASVALGINNPDKVIENIGSAGLEFLGGYMLTRAYVRNRADFMALCRFMGWLVVFTLPFALVESQTGHPVIIQLLDKIPGIRVPADVHHPPRLGLLRSQVMLVHPIHYGLFCSTAFALTFVGLRDSMSTHRRWATSGAVALCTLLSLSSGAFLALLLQFGLITWSIMIGRHGKSWLILLSIFSVCYVIVDTISNRSGIEVFLSYATLSPATAYWRTIIFEWGMKNVWANPIFGIGLNDWVRPWFMYSGSMDNFWLVNAVRYGIPGFILLAAGYGLAIWQVGRQDFSSDRQLSNLRLAWMITFCGLTFTLCTVHVWTTLYSFVFFTFGSGIWFMDARPGSGKDADIQASTPPKCGVSYSRITETNDAPARSDTDHPNSNGLDRKSVV